MRNTYDLITNNASKVDNANKWKKLLIVGVRMKRRKLPKTFKLNFAFFREVQILS